MMNEIYSGELDFEATVAILTADQGGRQIPPQNGIRWDFRYFEDDITKGLYMIHPCFLDANGGYIPKGRQINGMVSAHMHIVFREMVDYHRKRISVGTKFYCHEGSHVVAKGVVTKLLGLRA